MPPILTSISPTSTPASKDITLFAFGSNITADTRIAVNGTALERPVAPSLTGLLPGDLITTPGTYSVTISDATGTSGSLPLTVTPQPVITDLLPPTLPTGRDTNVYVLGLNFDYTCVVYWGATALSTNVANGTLIAYVPARLLQTAGAVSITVKKSTTYTSDPVTLTVTAGYQPTLAITRLLPAAIPCGASLTLQIEGTDFAPGAVVYAGSIALTTQYGPAPNDDQTFLTATLPGSITATPGSLDITVQSGGVVSNALTFTVLDAPPETPHPYNNKPFSITQTVPGSPANIYLTFDPQSFLATSSSVASGNDVVTITSPTGFNTDYRSTDLAGLTVHIVGDTFTLTIHNLQSSSGYPPNGGTFGFRVLGIAVSAPGNGSYLLGNRNSQDINWGVANPFFPGPQAAQHPSYLGASDPVHAPQSLPFGLSGAAYSYQFRFPNAAVGNVTWSQPSATLTFLTLDPASGLLSGTLPAFDTEAQFTVLAVDSAGKSATGLFKLRVFRKPVDLREAGLTDDLEAPMRKDFAWAFKLGAALYSVMDNGNSCYIRKSVNKGLAWSTINPNDTNAGNALDYFRQDSTLYVTFWRPDSNYGPYRPNVKSLDLTTGVYTDVYTGPRTYLIGFSETPTRTFRKPDGSFTHFAQTNENTGTQRLYLVTGNGATDTLISDNVPATSTTPISAAIGSVLMEDSGIFHVLFSVTTQGNGALQPSTTVEYFYRRVNRSNSLGPLVKLDPAYFNRDSATDAPNDAPAIGCGYIRQADNEMVFPVVAPRATRGLGGNRLCVLRGSPLLSPTFTVEVVDAPLNRDTSNERLETTTDRICAFQDADGADAIAFISRDQFAGSRGDALYLVRNERDGSGWSYRDVLCQAARTPLYPTVFTMGSPVVFPDPDATSGYRCLFIIPDQGEQ
jgi:hypothetical protein